MRLWVDEDLHNFQKTLQEIHSKEKDKTKFSL